MSFKTILKGLLKTAALNPDVQLKDHQQRAIDKVLDRGSMVIAHGTGTGKTLTGIGAIERLREQGKANKTLVVVPSSLKTNFADHGIKKFTNSRVHIVDKGKDTIDPEAHYNVVSNALFAKDPERYSEGADSIIVDEAHNLRNSRTGASQALERISPNLKHRILLTASPFNNSPSDLVPLINAVKGEQLYADQKEFDEQYIQEVKKRMGLLGRLGVGKKHKVDEKFVPDAELKKYLQDYFDYEKGDEGLPEVENELVRIPMTREQHKAYRYAWNQMPAAVRFAVKRDIVPQKRDTVSFFGSLANARVASNNPAALLQKYKDDSKGYQISGKIQQLLKDLEGQEKDPHGAMVYTNYNTHGANVIDQALKDKGLTVSKISGGMNRKQKDEQIEEFKKGKSKAFIVSPTGKEGISLPNVSKEIIYDPHWNPEVTRQAIGRGVRADSKAKKVQIKRYIAVEPDRRIFGVLGKKPNRSVEEWIESVAEKKKALQSQVYDSFGR